MAMNIINPICPVCGRHSFTYVNSYEICPVCGWENEEYQANHPNEDGGANGVSLVEYKNKWKTGKKAASMVLL